MNIGSIIQWTSNTIPDGWLLCDGTAVSRTTYADLFSVIGTQFGTGDGSTTFNLPDLRGRVGVGKSSDTEFDTLGETGGSKTHTLTVEEMPSHNHTGIKWNGSNVSLNQSGSSGYGLTWQSGASSDSDNFENNNTGGGQAHSILQPYLVTNYIIKATIPDTIKISELESASAITSDDVLPIVQNGETKKINVLDMIYPVGSIYMSVSSTNPSTYFGGTWTAWGSGRVPVGVDTNDSDFDIVEETGGEKTHTLTTQEIPTHNHYISSGASGTTTFPAFSGVASNYTGDSQTQQNPLNLTSTGGGQAHNNLQPYITCYMWKRTA